MLICFCRNNSGCFIPEVCQEDGYSNIDLIFLHMPLSVYAFSAYYSNKYCRFYRILKLVYFLNVFAGQTVISRQDHSVKYIIYES